MYADDSTIHTSARMVEELNNKLTEDMTNVQAWCTNNNLVLNDGKTKAMMITTYQRAAILNSKLRVEFNGVQLKNTYNEKLLGVVMNEHLSWKQQIDKVANSLIKGIIIFWDRSKSICLLVTELFTTNVSYNLT